MWRPRKARTRPPGRGSARPARSSAAAARPSRQPTGWESDPLPRCNRPRPGCWAPYWRTPASRASLHGHPSGPAQDFAVSEVARRAAIWTAQERDLGRLRRVLRPIRLGGVAHGVCTVLARARETRAWPGAFMPEGTDHFIIDAHPGDQREAAWRQALSRLLYVRIGWGHARPRTAARIPTSRPAASGSCASHHRRSNWLAASVPERTACGSPFPSTNQCRNLLCAAEQDLYAATSLAFSRQRSAEAR